LADACWHRLAPLSKGTILGDELQCPYHGLRYSRSGRCTEMPAQQTVNPSAAVPSLPVVERHRFVWVWLGDPDLADPGLVPDMHQMDSSEWAGDGETIEAKCNYQLVLDNLMDLTHEEFVHSSSIGQDELSESDFDVRHDDRTVTVSRWMHDIEAPPFWRKNMRDRFPDFVGRVDRWQIIHFEAPSTICIDVGVAKAGTGAPEGDRSQGVNGFVMNTITPETDRTSHYFWAFMRNYRLESQTITRQLRDGVHGVFGEDEEMLIAQQEAIDANPDYEFYSLNIDAGGMWVRRILDGMLQAEGRSFTVQARG
jgi:phenylpropionate dioxygenase-like ring-hydroxylating dioxygenase large terminal subunit